MDNNLLELYKKFAEDPINFLKNYKNKDGQSPTLFYVVLGLVLQRSRIN
jgi:hypothetical protein